MARPIRLIQSLSLACSLVTALSCDNPTGPLFPALDLSLASELGAKQVFFEGEPIYVAFALSNHGTDTIWTRPFSFGAWDLDGEVTDSTGTPLSKWGIIVDYIYGRGYRGEPLAPGKRFYEVQLIQDRWGEYRTDMENAYFGHYLPPGQYTLRMHFVFDVPGRWVSRVVYSDPISFRVRPRDPVEEQSFQRFQTLLAMPRDSLDWPAFADSVMANVQSRPPDDPILPFITGAWGWATQYWTDSSKRDALVNVSTAVARVQRASGAGAYAVLTVNYLRPTAVSSLAEELSGSLAGDVAASLVDR